MGGMIAQRMALAAPQRVQTLTSIMSSSGARHLPGPRPHVLQVLLSRPRDHSESVLLAHYVRLFEAIGGPAYPSSHEELRQRILSSVRRGGYRPRAAPASWRRWRPTPRGRRNSVASRRPRWCCTAPTIPWCPSPAARHARRIPGARFVAVPGMGHDLPPAVVERLLDPLLAHLRLGSPP